MLPAKNDLALGWFLGYERNPSVIQQFPSSFNPAAQAAAGVH
jgi:hypothetical protein